MVTASLMVLNVPRATRSVVAPDGGWEERRSRLLSSVRARANAAVHTLTAVRWWVVRTAGAFHALNNATAIKPEVRPTVCPMTVL